MVKKEKAKDKLFETASRLFFHYGYQSIGVDTIAEASGISKMTLYRNYGSKDDLIEAYLRHSDKDFWMYFEQSIAEEDHPKEKIIAFFRFLENYTKSPSCYGCPFLNIVSEFPDPDYIGHQIAIEHKKSVANRFKVMAETLGVSELQSLANGLLLLMDGAYIAARLYRMDERNPVQNLVQNVVLLLDSYLN